MIQTRGGGVMKKSAIAMLCTLAISMPAIAAGFKHENKPENLRALFTSIHQAAYAKKDAKQAAELTQSVMPDEGRVKKALRENVGGDALQRIVGMHNKMGPMSEREVVKLVKAEHKNIRVSGA